METLETRISRLERNANRWRIISICFGLAFICFFAMGQASLGPKTIETDRIIFRDAAGKIRMDLGLHGTPGKPADSLGLTFYNDDGAEAGNLRMVDNSPHLIIHGSAKDSVHDAEEMIARVKDTPQPMKTAMLAQAEAHGADVMALGSGGFFLFNNQHGASVAPDGIVVTGALIKVQDTSAGGAHAILGGIETVDPQTGAKTTRPASTLTLMDAAGKIVFQTP
jgi:hypothetical protein